MTRYYDEGAAIEFPDYPLNSLPAMPDGYSDSSWAHDACPSIRNGSTIIYLDYPHPGDREFDAPRFIVINDATDAYADALTLLATDDWSEVLAHVACY